MSVSSFAVRRYQLTIVVFLMLLALGVSALFRIPKAEDPTFPIPIFSVVAVYPGASPSDVEKLVVDPVEAKLKALDDVKSIKTQIDDGLAVMIVEFTAGSDADKKYDEVLRETNAERPGLPPELLSLEVKKQNASNVAIAQIALVSDTAPYKDLQEAARKLERRIEACPGVKEASTWALPKQEVRVALDLERLAALHISPREVTQAIASTNANIPAGSVDAGGRRFNVRTSGDFTSVEQVRNVVVATDQSKIVKLSDVAEVDGADEEAVYIGRYDGHRAVFLTATSKEGQNVFQVKDAIAAQLAQFETTLPEGVKLERGFDQTHNVAHRLSGFTRDFLLAIGLVLLTLLPLGVRASVVVMVSIPLSLSIGLAILDALGYSINQLSIVGFVIALGLLVDDSVVVVENIARVLRSGMSPRDAAIEGTRQITVSVLGCTATLVFAFIPLLFLPGTAGQFIRSLPLAVVATIVASLAVSLTIVPFLASRLLKPEAEHGNVFLRLLNRGIEGSDRRVLTSAIAHPKSTLVLAAALFAGSLALIPVVGFSLFPKAGTPQFLVTIETPDGSTLGETDRAVRFAESTLDKTGKMRFVMANVGKGNPQIYYNVAQKNEKANVGEVFAELEHFDPIESPKLYDRLRTELAAYPGARIELKELENGPPVDAPVAVRLIGDDLGDLTRAAADVEKILEATPGTLYVRNPSREKKTDLRVVIDRERAGLIGASLADVDGLVRMAVAGVSAGKYRQAGLGDESQDIHVELPRATRPTVDALDRVFLPAPDGPIPLSEIARVELEASPASIRHFNRERSVTVSANVKTGYNTDRVTKAALADLDALKLPPGVRLEAAGEIESRKESFGGLGAAVIVAAFGVLAVLVLEFRTFKSTLIVASVIPLGIVGGIAALFLSHNTLSFTASIGFIALIGIEVKNSILLVDFTNELRRQGVALDEAIRRAGEIRFVPILLTTLTALGGLVPLALEHSSLYSPLAVVIIGGLVSSTVLTRVVTPVMYKLFAPEMEELT